MRALFVCVRNAGRSQMAQAFAEAVGIEARSAGSAPADAVQPEVVAALAECGIDVSRRVPRSLDRDDVGWAVVIVTMGCGDACPFVPGKRYVDWELEDPHGAPPERVREIRDDVERRVRELYASLSTSQASASG